MEVYQRHEAVDACILKLHFVVVVAVVAFFTGGIRSDRCPNLLVGFILNRNYLSQ